MFGRRGKEERLQGLRLRADFGGMKEGARRGRTACPPTPPPQHTHTHTHAPEDALADGGLRAGGRAAEAVEGDAEPGVDVGVDRVVLVADLGARQALLQRLLLGAGVSGFSGLLGVFRVQEVKGGGCLRDRRV